MAYEPRHAGKGQRFLNFLIDYAGCMGVGMESGLIAGIIWGEGAVRYFEGAPGLAIGALLAISYYTLFEGAFGRTPGKWVTGTRVVDEHGNPPSLPQALGRSFARFIPFEAFSVLLDDNSRGWHDSLAKTYVVRTRP